MAMLERAIAARGADAVSMEVRSDNRCRRADRIMLCDGARVIARSDRLEAM
jgi:hypothetical protein